MECEYAARVCPDGRVQTVKEHTMGVNNLAMRDARLMGYEAIVSLVCLLHDMGKNTANSNEYQHTVGMGKKWDGDKPIHSHAGARLIYDRYGQKEESRSTYSSILSELLETVIMSHHGLFDCLRSSDSNGEYNGLKKKLYHTDYDYEEARGRLFSDIINAEELDARYQEAQEELVAVLSKISGMTRIKSELCYYLSVFERMMLSILVNADHTDAAAFALQEEIPSSYGSTEDWLRCCAYLERRLEALSAETPIHRIRSEISHKALKAAEKDNSIIRLSVPTGGGKTLSSLRYALSHAVQHHKRRIIYVAPFNSILEQNAEQFRVFLPDDVELLEHYGDMIDYENNASQKYRYYSENWGSPIIATSMVQFLNTLFSHKISSIRRMRGLINAVIILDEIQSIPIECITILNLAINFLSEICGCTVVLCSATQPALDQIKHRIRFSRHCELIDNYQEYAAQLKRTRIIDSRRSGGYSYREAADFVIKATETTQSVLMIVNTKSAARSVYNILKGRIEASVFTDHYYLVHLSTHMCPAHRKRALAALRENLSASKKVICINTQLIEAGVDISFETVVRSLAGLDSIIQSAGRCNRNMETDIGNVHIVNLSEENISMLKTIRIGAAVTRQLLETMRKNPMLYGGDIAGEEAVKAYYNKYYGEFAPELDYKVKLESVPDTTIYQLLSTNREMIGFAQAHGCRSTNTFFNQSFKTAGELFKAIDDYGRTVVVPYNKGKELIARLCSDAQESYSAGFFRELQKYSISLSDKLLEGRVIRDEDTGILMLKESYYNDEYGFDEDGEMEMLFI